MSSVLYTAYSTSDSMVVTKTMVTVSVVMVIGPRVGLMGMEQALTELVVTGRTCGDRTSGDNSLE